MWESTRTRIEERKKSHLQNHLMVFVLALLMGTSLPLYIITTYAILRYTTLEKGENDRRFGTSLWTAVLTGIVPMRTGCASRRCVTPSSPRGLRILRCNYQHSTYRGGRGDGREIEVEQITYY